MSVRSLRNLGCMLLYYPPRADRACLRGSMGRRPRRPRRASFAPRLIVMAKSPVAGRIKRRLAARDRRCHRQRGSIATCLAPYAAAARLAIRAGARLLAVSPDTDMRAPHWRAQGIEPRACRKGVAISAMRMQRLFRRLPPGPAIIVGSDIPAIKPSEIAKAFRLLGNADAVFGPRRRRRLLARRA